MTTLYRTPNVIIDSHEWHAVVRKRYGRSSAAYFWRPLSARPLRWLAAANWLNPEYAEKVICAGPDRLKPQQIRDARFFSSLGRDISDIAVTIGARSIDQVKRVLSGATYSRIA